MRGEHGGFSTPKTKLGGSSPRARGALGVVNRYPRPPGIIPACAGSTRRNAQRSAPARDHPRVRGEHPYPRVPILAYRGSSPRARGARRDDARVDALPGIIPACAGSTPTSSATMTAPRDHPRVRGEHWRAPRKRPWGAGSSPRARGALQLEQRPPGGPGIIPACAGSTDPAPAQSGHGGDHPRVRGEHRAGAVHRPTPWGSSPRARGALQCSYGCLDRGGIIPACAGSTRARLQSLHGSEDHPRVRGEHPMTFRHRRSTAGSSPRARGARRRWHGALDCVGIIPACAGSTP